MFGSINGLELNNLSELMILIPNLHDFIGSNTPSYLMKKTEKSPIYIQFKSKTISIICLIQWEEPLTDNPRTSNMFEKESGRKKNGITCWRERKRERFTYEANHQRRNAHDSDSTSQCNYNLGSILLSPPYVAAQQLHIPQSS
jgi:hypothetical protein